MNNGYPTNRGLMKTILTDGQKSIDLNSSDPSIWTYLSGAPETEFDVLYAKVSAVYSVLNAKANIIGNMPFTLLKANGDEYDSSATWENKVGFMPQPSELFRIDTLSYSVSNTIYNLKNTDALGYKTKRLVNAVPYTFSPYAPNGYLEYIERTINGKTERYTAEDKRLFRVWRLDHTTELLPSANTEARAMMNAAGILHSADLWIKHFYERGGVAPTVIAMKGAISSDKRDDEEKNWSNWLRGLGKWRTNIARVFNADALDVKQFGSSVTDLKDNVTYEQALRNVATVINAPLSMLFPDSNKYGVAKSEEKATWMDVYVIPFCNWLAYGYNEQIFKPMGLFLKFHPETLDPQQEDETARAAAVNQFMDFLSKCPTYEVFIGTCETFGYELSDSLIKAAETYYSDKEKQAEETRQQINVSTDGKPVAQVQPAEDTPEDDAEDAMPAKWIPNLDQIRELQRWQDLAFRKFKRDEPLAFEWRNDTLPEGVYKAISTNLPNAKEESAIKQVFDMAEMTAAPVEVKAESDILKLAEALNKLADVEHAKLPAIN